MPYTIACHHHADGHRGRATETYRNVVVGLRAKIGGFLWCEEFTRLSFAGPIGAPVERGSQTRAAHQ
jgi:hypothetical protein